MIAPNQIFRHFKGGLYLILSLAKCEDDPQGDYQVIYRSLNGDDKIWSRNKSEFESDVPEGKFNPTGQTKRFELVTNLRNQLSLASTQSLIEELRTRKDSPLNDMNIEGFNDFVLETTYRVCFWSEPSENFPKGCLLSNLLATDSYEQAKKFLENHPEYGSSHTKIVKETVVDCGT